jgi:hypothetical protein
MFIFNLVVQFLNKRHFRSKIGDIAPLMQEQLNVKHIRLDSNWHPCWQNRRLLELSIFFGGVFL